MHVNHIRANGWNEKTIAVLWNAVLPKHFKRQHFTQVQTLIQWCTEKLEGLNLTVSFLYGLNTFVLNITPYFNLPPIMNANAELFQVTMSPPALLLVTVFNLPIYSTNACWLIFESL